MKLALVVNSHSCNKECAKLFFYCLKKYINIDIFNCIYFFIDKKINNIPSYAQQIIYNNDESFKDQMIHCLKNVKEDYLLYCNEDYLFYSEPNYKIIYESLEKLKNSNHSFIKFVHTDTETYKQIEEKYFLINSECENNYSQALSFWKTKDLLNIHINCPISEIGKKGDINKHLEIEAKQVCKKLKISGLCYYNQEPKRGLVHYDSEVFPHIASALNRGQWNSEYSELEILKKEFEQYENNKQFKN